MRLSFYNSKTHFGFSHRWLLLSSTLHIDESEYFVSILRCDMQVKMCR